MSCRNQSNSTIVADPSQHKSALSGRNDMKLMDTIGDSISHISLQWVPNLLHVVLLLMTVGQRGPDHFSTNLEIKNTILTAM